jgi:hypothetical protein
VPRPALGGHIGQGVQNCGRGLVITLHFPFSIFILPWLNAFIHAAARLFSRAAAAITVGRLSLVICHLDIRQQVTNDE